VITLGVIEMGLQSTAEVGFKTSTIGVMKARFHWAGTVAVSIERLNSWAMGAEKTGAMSLKNQAGMRSRPVAVGWRWSKI